MSEQYLDNSLFRNIYCYLISGSEGCTARGYEAGFLPAGMEWLAFLVTAVVMALVVINLILGGVIGVIWGERRILARFQNRRGPNRWGPFGMLTSVADAIKTMFKEDVLPFEADRVLYTMAPILMVLPVLLVFTVIPLGAGTFIVDLNVGVLFVLGITSLGGLAVMMAAWSSGNRISIFSGLRAVAMLVSYEIPMALALLGILMIAGSMSLGAIIAAQNVPFILVQPLGFLVFFLASLAEMNRTPFDLNEAESELAAGYLNDYSSMKFGVFFLAEFAAELAASALITTLFLSGWRGWDAIPSHAWFALKLVGVMFLILWVRFTLPRFRIDQILALAWKGLFELTLINLVVTAILIGIWPQPTTAQLWAIAAINWVVFFPAVWLVGKVLTTKPYESPSVAPGQSVYPVAVAQIPASSSEGGD